MSSSYQSLLSSFGSSGSPATLQINIGRLAPSQEYLIQAWSNTSSPSYDPPTGTTRFSQLGDSSNYVDLVSNTNSTLGGLGQYAVGTFTADSSSLVLELNGQGGALPIISGFQIRAVPEPSTYLLGAIGIGIAGLMRWRKRRVS